LRRNFTTMVRARSHITAALEAAAVAHTRAAIEKLRARYAMAQDEQRVHRACLSPAAQPK